jgi:hypothetical protein
MADLVLTAANVKATNAQTKIEYGRVAAAAVAAGDVVCIDSTGKAALADTDSATALIRTPRGIALNSAAADQHVAIAYAGSVTLGAVLTKGTIYALSDVAGKIRPVADNGAGDYVNILGVAASTTELVMNVNASGIVI